MPSDTPQFKARDTAKSQIRSRIEGIKKRLTILKKLFASNPKDMAKALSQVFKELKALVSAYKAAVEKDIGTSASAVATGISADSLLSGDTDTAKLAGSEPAQPSDPRPASAPTEDKAALYAQATAQVQAMAGEDGLNFSHQVRDLIHEIEDKILTPARLQMKARPSDKKTEAAFTEVETDLKALRGALADMDNDIKTEAPAAGQVVNLAV